MCCCKVARIHSHEYAYLQVPQMSALCVCGGCKGHEGLFPVPSTQGTAAGEDAVERCSEGAQFAEEES